MKHHNGLALKLTSRFVGAALRGRPWLRKEDL